MKIELTIYLIVALFFCAITALAATIHVPGAQPTIQAGIDAAIDGDTVIVADGTYQGEGNKNLDFNGKAITVRSENGPENCIIDCEGNGRGFYFKNGEGEDSVVSGFTIINGNATGLDGAGVDTHFSSPVITNNIISNNQGWGISTRGASNPLIQENIISDNSGGIEIFASQPTINGNIIQKNTGYGIETGNTRIFTIVNNILSENGKDGVNIGIPFGSEGAVEIINNTIITNSGSGISGNRDTILNLLNNIITNSQNCGIFFDTSYDWGIPNNNFNDVWGNVGGNYCGLAAAGTNDVFATPLFLSPLSGDYHLLPTSPCIDAGTNEGAPKIDFDGDDRPIDGNADGIARVDIGADEAGLLLSHDIAVQLTLPQTVPIKFGTSFTPEARLMNFGSHNEDGFTVTCEIRLKSIPIYSETQTLLHLDSMSMVNVDFSNWTPQAIGNYQLKVYTQLSGDENPSNDTEKRTVKVLMEDPNVFGIDRGNTWKYQGKTYTLEKEVVSLDQTTFPTVTYIVEDRENGEKYRGWYEKTPGELKLWGTQEVATGEFIRFSAGLVEAWYPMQVGDQRYSYATAESNLYPGIIVNTSLTADVLAKEPAILDFDTFEAFKVRYQLRLWGYGIDETDTFYQWVVPYLGVVKYQDTEQLEKLTSFIIGGGTITEETDTDGDGLKDYQELIIYDTSLADSDTDNDSMPDGWEVFYGLDPKSNDSTEDFDGDGYSNLIEYLRGTAPNDPNSHPHRAMPWIPLLLLGE